MSKGEETFSYRWGVPTLDDGFTTFPNHFWRVYSQILSREEWLFVCHLATYKYESERGACKPSLVTVARQMGYKDVRSVQKLRASLEKKTFHDTHLLVVVPRPGEPNLYDFSGMSKCLMSLSQAGGEPQFTPTKNEPESPDSGEPQFTPSGEPQFTPVVNPSSPKEEETRNKKQEEKKRDLHVTWSQCLVELEMSMTRVTFDQWLRDATLTGLDPGKRSATIQVRDRYAAEWCTDRLNTPIRRSLAGITGIADLAITYQAKAEPEPEKPDKQAVATPPVSAGTPPAKSAQTNKPTMQF